MDTQTNDSLLRIIDSVTDMANQLENLPIKGVEVVHIRRQLSQLRRELIEADLSD